MVTSKNAMNHMDCKGMKRNSITRSRHNKIAHKYILKPSYPFWPCDEKRGTRTSCDNWNGNNRRKMQQRETTWKDVGWTNKVAQSRRSDKSTESDER